jgi:hypothetical protein
MDTSIEERLKALEATVAKLKQQNIQPEINWIEQITGSFKDDPIFDEILAYGREFRYADRHQL